MLYGYIRFTVGDNQDNSLEAQTNLLKKKRLQQYLRRGFCMHSRIPSSV